MKNRITVIRDDGVALHLPMLPPAGPWIDEGKCAEADPEAWFPPPGGSSAEAKRVCARCPVLRECRDYALTAQPEFGVWGGLTARERRSIRARTNWEAA